MQIANVTNQNSECLQWLTINWKNVNRAVNNLRQRIYRASANGDVKKVKSLQKLMLKSKANKLLAIRQVTQQNQGRHTSGVDNFVIDNDKARERLYYSLNKANSEKPYPVKRIYIPKKNGKSRPLGIPAIVDRCRQAIVKSALEPYWEAKFERTSYGFRPGRSAHDAMQRIYCIARAGKSRCWLLDADIKNAFDNINHNFLMKTIGHFPARKMIYQWLTAGIMDNGRYSATTEGTPQGAVLSPLLANIALHGMETLFGIKYEKNGTTSQTCQYAMVRYADDFVVFAKTREACEEARNRLKTWLAERGLELSDEKTRIRHLKEGFDFLGFNIRHYPSQGKKRGYVFLSKPSKPTLQSYKREIRHTWKRVIGLPTTDAIRYLNAKIIGWSNYFRIGASKRTFNALDDWMWTRQARYLYRRHPNKHWWWRIKYYYGKVRGRQDRWVFMDKATGKFLWKHAWTEIKRHILVKGSASPDNPELREYWRKRQAKKTPFLYGVKPILAKRQKGICPICEQGLDNNELLHVHHIIPKVKGGDNRIDNLSLLHKACHRQAHSKKHKLQK